MNKEKEEENEEEEEKERREEEGGSNMGVRVSDFQYGQRGGRRK